MREFFHNKRRMLSCLSLAVLTVLTVCFVYLRPKFQAKSATVVVSTGPSLRDLQASAWDTVLVAANEEVRAGMENQLVRQAISLNTPVEGSWIGFGLDGYEDNRVIVRRHRNLDHAYLVEFKGWSCTFSYSEQRAGVLKDGAIILESPVERWEIGKSEASSFRVLFVVSANDHRYLLPSVSMDELTSTDQLQPNHRLAYEGPHLEAP